VIDDRLASTPSDQRTRQRQRVLLSGKLLYGDADLTADCAIRDISPGGARVRIQGPIALPSRVRLIEVKTGRAFDCEVVWRRMPELGLRFLGAYDLNHDNGEQLKMLKRVWTEAANRYALPE
jgi:hypothetical protein